MSGKDETTGSKIRTEAELRAERLAKTLRDNLQRRKQQARARRAGEADETDHEGDGGDFSTRREPKGGRPARSSFFFCDALKKRHLRKPIDS